MKKENGWGSCLQIGGEAADGCCRSIAKEYFKCSIVHGPNVFKRWGDGKT